MKMRVVSHIRRLALAAVLSAGTFFFAAGCEDDQEYSRPPAGFGRLVIENYTTEDIRPYVDGVAQELVGNGHDRAYDLAPGQHRVVLDQKGGTHLATVFEMDALENRVMIAEVREDYGVFGPARELQVRLRIQ